MTSKLIGVAAIGVVVLSFGFATGATGAECSGYDILVTEIADTMDLGNGASLMLWKANSILTNDDPNARDHLIAGTCAGTIETTSDGSVKMAGHCSRTNADGDIKVIRWWQNPGDEKGSWEHVTGAGVFADAKESGWFENVMANGVTSATLWGGECE
jgi:hypothetical protein